MESDSNGSLVTIDGALSAAKDEGQRVSLRLRIASYGLRLVGWGGILAVAVAVGAIVWSGESFRELTQRPWDLMLAVSTCAGFVVIGDQLRRRKRSAAVVAIGTCLLPLLSIVFGSMALTIPTVSLCLLSAMLVASTWKELRD